MVETSEIINVPQSLDRLGGDKELLNDLITFFFEDFPALLDEVRTSVINQEWASVQRAAHSLKGLVANFSATRAKDVFQQIEAYSVNKDQAKLTPLLEVAEQEIELLVKALNEYHGKIKSK